MKNEGKHIINQENLEMQIIQSLFISEELENILSQRYEEPEEEYTYEELLQIGEQIGKVSKGLSDSQISQLATEMIRTATNCSICLVVMNKGTRATKLNPCGHTYHFDCIETWLKENKTCPLCLQEIKI